MGHVNDNSGEHSLDRTILQRCQKIGGGFKSENLNQ
jgi:hypothetical protein